MLNSQNFNKLFREKFDSNYHEAARQLGTDAGYVHRIVSGKRKAGVVFIERLLNWCSRNDVEYSNLIFLPQPLPCVKPTKKQAKKKEAAQ